MSQTEFEEQGVSSATEPVSPESPAVTDLPEADPFAAYEPSSGSEPAAAKPEPFQPAAVFDAAAVPAAPSRPENVLAGIVGAFLFSLIGGLGYFLIYQAGYIAGICGLITMILAAFGYGLFSGRKNSMKGVVASVIFTVITLFLAEYFCLAFEIFKSFSADYGIDFFDALRATPTFLVDPEILPSVLFDLASAYVLGAVASFSNSRAAIRANRAEKAAKQAK